MRSAVRFLFSLVRGAGRTNDVSEQQAPRDYSQREIRFSLAHWEELVTLDEAGESGRDLREALKHELANLPEHSVCTCNVNTTIPEAADGAGGAGRWRTPSVALTDIKRAIAALPLASKFRTTLYLMTTPTHSAVLSDFGERCRLGYYGEQNGVLGHLVYLTETQVHELAPREFEARHRRRVATTGFMQQPRPQDGWDVRDGYRFLTDYLNLGQDEFLATWSDIMAPRERVAA